MNQAVHCLIHFHLRQDSLPAQAPLDGRPHHRGTAQQASYLLVHTKTVVLQEKNPVSLFKDQEKR